MKKDRISCKLRSLRNQKPRTRERFLDRTALLLKARLLRVSWHGCIDGVAFVRSPEPIFSTTYDYILVEEAE